MSSVRRGVTGGRGRGSGAVISRSTPRAPRSSRGRKFGTDAEMGENSTVRGTFRQPTRGNAPRGPRGASDAGRTMAFQTLPTTPGAFGRAHSRGSWQDRYQALTKAREQERARAIRQGLIADPDHPRSLADAITPVGTCQDMCAEYERVERVVQKDIWMEETDHNHSAYSAVDREPDESRMVKKFRRAAAGLEEQLPSDLRPPPVLKHTCDYLFNEVIGYASRLEDVHHFVWDRTRAIRNDFSIQQITKPEDLRIAIDCYERIARFHILSLHQLAVQPKPYDKYDSQQEREQLDRTLLSLMQYYDDSRGRIEVPNEPEFRSYCVIFQLQDPTPDLEDRVQCWPLSVLQDRRVQQALEVHAAACNTMDAQGPLKPRASHLIAQQDWQRFWTLVESDRVSYLMGCVAEIYFNLVRRTVLNALLRAFKQSLKKAEQDWTVDALSHVLALDDADKTINFCEQYGFSFGQRQDGQEYLDLTSIRERNLPDSQARIPKQLKSELVESKRLGRTLPAVINGFSVKEAQDRGMALEEQREEEMEDVDEADGTKMKQAARGDPLQLSSSDSDPGSLFLPENNKAGGDEAPTEKSDPPVDGLDRSADAQPISSRNSGAFSFGKPSATTGFGAPSFHKPDGNLDRSASATGIVPAPSTERKVKFDFTSSTPNAEPSGPTPSALNTTGLALPEFQPSTFSFGRNASNPEAGGNASGLADSKSIFAKPAAHGPSSGASPFSWQSPGVEPKPSPVGGSSVPPKPFEFSTSPPADVESVPNSPDKHSFTFGQPASILTSSPSQPADHKISQPPYTAAPLTQSLVASHNTTSPISNARKASLSTDTRPKTPSPLSNSFNFEDVTNPSAGSTFGNKRPTRDLLQRRESKVSQESFPATKQAPQLASITSPNTVFDRVVATVAEEIIADPVSGFIHQYIEFAIQQVVTEIQEKLQAERAQAEAVNFRRESLLHRYSKRWRTIFWEKRRALHKSKRRDRLQKLLDEQRSERESETRSVQDTDSVMGSDVGIGRRGEEADAKARCSMLVVTPECARIEQQMRAGNKRPLSFHGNDTSTALQEAGHKRLKSTSHLDNRGRIAKPATSTNPNADILKRSSFLGFSATGNAKNSSTTKSNYFRLKALGINPTSDAGASRGIERQRSESEVRPSTKQPSIFGAHSLQHSNPKQNVQNAPNLPSSSVTSTIDVNEALLARLKAARESLHESASFFKDHATRREESKRASSSQSSNESPSITMARAEVKACARQAASQTASRAEQDVPAYRLRESKFVPREQYRKAIDRANEVRALRSRKASRPTLGADDSTSSELDAKADDSAHLKKAYEVQQSTICDQVSMKARKMQETLPQDEANLEQYSIPPSTAYSRPPTFGVAHFQTWNWGGDSSFLPPPTTDQSVHSNAHSPAQEIVGVDRDKHASFVAQTVHEEQTESDRVLRDCDFTIQPSQIEVSLSASFGDSGITRNPSGVLDHHHHQEILLPSQPSPTVGSRAVSETVSLISDDEDEQQQPNQHNEAAINGFGTDDDTEESLDNAADEDADDAADYYLENSYGHINTYAALASEDKDDEEEQVGDGDHQEDDDGEAEEVEYDDEPYDDEDLDEDEVEGRNGYVHRVIREEGVDGDIEDAEEEDEEDEDEIEAEDEDAHAQVWNQGLDDNGIDPRTGMWRQDAAKNPVLQGVGGTVEEAIELSD